MSGWIAMRTIPVRIVSIDLSNRSGSCTYQQFLHIPCHNRGSWRSSFDDQYQPLVSSNDIKTHWEKAQHSKADTKSRPKGEFSLKLGLVTQRSQNLFICIPLAVWVVWNIPTFEDRRHRFLGNALTTATGRNYGGIPICHDVDMVRGKKMRSEFLSQRQYRMEGSTLGLVYRLYEASAMQLTGVIDKQSSNQHACGKYNQSRGVHAATQSSLCDRHR